MALSSTLAGALAQEGVVPLLKPDRPKLDTPSEAVGDKARKPLKGQVQTNVQSPARLRSGASASGGLSSAGSGRRSPYGQALKGRSDANTLRGRGEAGELNGGATSSVGIIGVRFEMYQGGPPVVKTVFPYTPAARFDVRQLDIIVAVDGVPTLGLTKEEVYDLIVGSPGTPVTLSLSRSGDYRVLTLTRMDLLEIPDPRVRAAYIVSR